MSDIPFPDIDFDEEDILNREILLHSKASTERSLARRLALQALYELDSTDHPIADVMGHFLSREHGSLSIQMVIGTTEDSLGEKFVAINDMIETRLVEGEEEQRVVRYFTRLVTSIVESQDMLDSVLQTYAPDFPIDQVAIIDRNILRIALHEIGIENNIPVSVAIDEAIELSKLFGAEATTRFVNGVLGTIANNLEAIRAMLTPITEVDEANV